MAEKLKSINRVFRTGEDRRNRRDPHCSPSVSRRNSQPPSSLKELKKVIDNDIVPLPCRRLTLDQVTKDMEALILSRQDDPFLQVKLYLSFKLNISFYFLILLFPDISVEGKQI
jgi:hypothetical protein